MSVLSCSSTQLNISILSYNWQPQSKDDLHNNLTIGGWHFRFNAFILVIFSVESDEKNGTHITAKIESHIPNICHCLKFENPLKLFHICCETVKCSSIKTRSQATEFNINTVWGESFQYFSFACKWSFSILRLEFYVNISRIYDEEKACVRLIIGFR